MQKIRYFLRLNNKSLIALDSITVIGNVKKEEYKYSFQQKKYEMYCFVLELSSGRSIALRDKSLDALTAYREAITYLLFNLEQILYTTSGVWFDFWKYRYSHDRNVVEILEARLPVKEPIPDSAQT